MSTAVQRLPGTDSLSDLIESACDRAIRKNLEIAHLRTKRLLKVPAAAEYIDLSPRELYNMLANGVFKAVKHGRCTLIDIEDLNAWIKTNKS